MNYQQNRNQNHSYFSQVASNALNNQGQGQYSQQQLSPTYNYPPQNQYNQIQQNNYYNSQGNIPNPRQIINNVLTNKYDPLQQYMVKEQSSYGPQQIYINGPVYKHTPLFVGPQHMPIQQKSMFTPVVLQKPLRNSVIEKALQEDWRKYPVEELYPDQYHSNRAQVFDQWHGKNYFYEERKVQEGSEPEKAIKKQQQQTRQPNQRGKPQTEAQKQIDLWSLPEEKKEQEKPVQEDLSIHSEKPKIRIKKQQVSGKKVTVPKKVLSRVAKNLRLFRIRLLFIHAYFKTIRKIILDRKKRFLITSSDVLNKALVQSTEWAMTCLEQFLQPFWSSKDKYDWLDEDTINEKEKDGRIRRSKVNQIEVDVFMNQVFIEKIIECMFDFSKESNFDKNLLKFLGDISQNFQFPPTKFYFNFEIMRLKFTKFGAIKDMTIHMKKMVISIYLIIRICCFSVLYAPWKLGMEGILETELLKQNCTMVTSIFHELVLQEFRDECPIIKNNQNHILQEHKVEPRLAGPLRYEKDPVKASDRKVIEQLVEPLIFPVYDGDELEDIFEKDLDWVGRMRDRLDDLYDRISSIVGGVYQIERKKLAQVKLVDKMQQIQKA